MNPLQKSSILLAIAGIVACSDSATAPGPRQVTVRFAVAGAQGSAAIANGASAALAEGPLVLTGSNGTLTIDEIALIVSKLEFEQSEDACELDVGAHGLSGDDDDALHDEECGEFRLNPAFIRLPLPGGVVTVGTDEVPEGTWTRLKFRVKNIDFDDDEGELDDDEDDNEDLALTGLFASVRTAFPDWPRKASLVVTGSFLPTGATTAIPFTTFFDGEIKVKMFLEPPLEVTAQEILTKDRVGIRVTLTAFTTTRTLLPFLSPSSSKA